jgi:hypothetical protein
MIRLILNSILILAVIAYIILLKIFSKRKDFIGHMVTSGFDCYNCKGFIDKKPYDDFGFDAFDSERFRICKSCNRDEKINLLTGESKFRFSDIKKFLYSKKSKKFMMGLNIFMSLALILDIVFAINKIDRTISYSIYILSIYLVWTINFYKLFLQYNKKST